MSGKRRASLALVWAAAAVMAGGLPAPAVRAAPAPSLTAAQAIQQDLLTQQAILTSSDPAVTLPAREQAAKKLVSRSSREADQILLGVLTNFGRPKAQQAQLAVARALIDDLTPEAAFVTPLGNLMGADSQLTEAAAQALASFKTDDRARALLTRFVANNIQPAPSRAGVVRAMGKLVDKRAAGALIDVLNRRNESSLVVSAAIDALVEMTGLANFRDPQQWNQWWNANKDRPDAEWSTDLLIKNARKASDMERRLEVTRKQLADLIRNERLEAKTPAERAASDRKLIDSYFKSPSEDVRLAALQVVEYENAAYGGMRVAPLMDAMRQMIGDSSPEVRKKVAQTLNDPAAVPALLTQLSQESDAGVEEAILLALGRCHDPRAIKPLVERLNDPSFAVAGAAADALRDIAQSLRELKKLDQMAGVAAALRQRFGQTTTDPAMVRLRESLVSAMAAVADPSLRDVFYELLKLGRESAEVRRWALRGLGYIGDPASANIILGQINDPDQAVRMAAAAALLSTASFGHAQEISRRLAIETDPGIRKQLWEVLAAVLKKGTAEDLAYWQDQFPKNDPESLTRRLYVLGLRETKLAAEGDSKRLAVLRQTLADTLLSLDKPEDAVAKLQLALAYWTSHNATEAELNEPRQHLLRALLQARKFGDASTYATTQIKSNQALNSDMWRIVTGELNRLERDPQTALAMLGEMKKVPWDKLYADALKQREQQLRNATSGGAIWARQPRRYEHVDAGKVAMS